MVCNLFILFKLEALGYEVDFQYAEDDVQMQRQQANLLQLSSSWDHQMITMLLCYTMV